jgi:hypothetical protein
MLNNTYFDSINLKWCRKIIIWPCPLSSPPFKALSKTDRQNGMLSLSFFIKISMEFVEIFLTHYGIQEERHFPKRTFEKTLVAHIKSNLLPNIQMYNMSLLQLNTIKKGLINN